MSDARRQELERLAASGDPDARRALFLELARAGDPDFQAALELRQRLRKAFYEVVDWASPPKVAPLSREVAVRYSALGAVLAAALSELPRERAHYVFRQIATSAHPRSPARCGALAFRLEDRVWVGLGISETQCLLPSGLWAGLVPWRLTSQRPKLLRRLEEWVEQADWQQRNGARVQRVVSGSAAAARLLCRLEESMGADVQGAWWSVSRDVVREPRSEVHPRDAALWGRVEELCSAWQPEDLEGILQDHFARARAVDLYPVEAEHLVALLSRPASGRLEESS